MKISFVTPLRKFSLAAAFAFIAAIVASSLLAQQSFENPFEDPPAKKSGPDAAKDKGTATDAGKKRAAPPPTNLDDPFGELTPPELRTPGDDKAAPPSDSTRRAPADSTLPPRPGTTTPARSATTRPSAAGDLPSVEQSPRLAPPESADPLAEPTGRAAPSRGVDDNPFEEMAPAPELDSGVLPDRELDSTRPQDSTTDELPSPDPSFDAFQRLIDEGKYAEAIPLLESQVKQTPEDHGAHFYLGIAYRMVNRFDDALKSLTTAAELAGDVPIAGEIYLRRGIVWLNKGEHRIAYTDFETASGMIANDPRAELWKGIALVKQNKAREAISAYSAALRFEPRYGLALMNRGLAYLTIDENDMAVTDFDEAIRLDPANAQAFHRRGVALGRRGDYEEAIRSYDAAIRLDPKLTDAVTNRRALLPRAGQSGRASAGAATIPASASRAARRAS